LATETKTPAIEKNTEEANARHVQTRGHAQQRKRPSLWLRSYGVTSVGTESKSDMHGIRESRNHVKPKHAATRCLGDHIDKKLK